MAFVNRFGYAALLLSVASGVRKIARHGGESASTGMDSGSSVLGGNTDVQRRSMGPGDRPPYDDPFLCPRPCRQCFYPDHTDVLMCVLDANNRHHTPADADPQRFDCGPVRRRDWILWEFETACFITEEGCSQHYTHAQGSVHRQDQMNCERISNKGGCDRLTSSRMCADLCERYPACASYEWSPLTLQCSLHTQSDPGGPPYMDFFHCQKPPPTPQPTPAPTPAPAWVLHGTGCEAGIDCIQSNNHPSRYGNNQWCRVELLGSISLRTHHFWTELDYDILTVGGVPYSGAEIFGAAPPPDGVYTGNITWSSDASIVNSGWKLCRTY